MLACAAEEKTWLCKRCFKKRGVRRRGAGLDSGNNMTPTRQTGPARLSRLIYGEIITTNEYATNYSRGQEGAINRGSIGQVVREGRGGGSGGRGVGAGGRGGTEGVERQAMADGSVSRYLV